MSRGLGVGIVEGDHPGSSIVGVECQGRRLGLRALTDKLDRIVFNLVIDE